jgi:hypothetical protein
VREPTATSTTATRPAYFTAPERAPSPARRKKKAESEAMDLDLDISGIEWKKSNRDGGGHAGPDAGWAWAFAFTKDGGILMETVQLLQALDQYERVIVDGFEICLGGRDKKLLNRKFAER